MLKINSKFDETQINGAVPVELVINGTPEQQVTEAAILCAQIAQNADLPAEIQPVILAMIFDRAEEIIKKDLLKKTLKNKVDLSNLSEFIQPEDREK